MTLFIYWIIQEKKKKAKAENHSMVENPPHQSEVHSGNSVTAEKINSIPTRLSRPLLFGIILYIRQIQTN